MSIDDGFGVNQTGLGVGAPRPYRRDGKLDIIVHDWLLEPMEQLGEVSHEGGTDDRLLRIRPREPVSDDELDACFRSFFSADCWYDMIGTGKTPFSAFVPLDRSDVDSILRRRPSRELIERVQVAVDTVMKCDTTQKRDCWFVRLNSLSPKHPGPHRCVREALDLLGTTPRTFATLKNPHMKHSIVVREFVPDMETRVEFRCFVHARTLRAISYYDPKPLSTEKLEHLRRRLPSARKVIAEFVAGIIGEVEYADFVADVAHTTLPEGRPEVLLIEVNTPVYDIAGSALFSVAADADLLWGEKKACETCAQQIERLEENYGSPLPILRLPERGDGGCGLGRFSSALEMPATEPSSIPDGR